MERHTFLQGLTWLIPYNEVYNHLEEDFKDDAPLTPQWPPITYNWPATDAASAASAAMHPPGRQKQRCRRTLASRVILQDSSCCLHRGPKALFFAAERPQDDATQMSFQIAMVEMNPAAFRAIVQQHMQRRRQQSRREEHEKQRIRRMERWREEREQRTPAPADDESSCLLQPPDSSSVSSSNTTGSGDGSNGWKDREGDEGLEEEDTKVEKEEDDDTVVPALFFRIDDHVYLVDHMAMETIVCPKGDPRAEAPPSSSTSSEPSSLPPYAAFKFPTVTLRFWQSRLSLSPLKATQPLISAIDAISRGLARRLWLPPSLEISPSATVIKPTAAAAAAIAAAAAAAARTGVKSMGKELGGAGGVEAAESFLRAVETLLLLQPSSSSSSSCSSSLASSAVEDIFLLRQAGRMFRKALVPLSYRMAGSEENKRTRGLLEEEIAWRRRWDRLLMQMFPIRRPPSGGAGGGGKESKVESDLVESVEVATAALKAVVRERHREAMRVRTVRAPQGEEPQTQQTQQTQQQQQALPGEGQEERGEDKAGRTGGGGGGGGGGAGCGPGGEGEGEGEGGMHGVECAGSEAGIRAKGTYVASSLTGRTRMGGFKKRLATATVTSAAPAQQQLQQQQPQQQQAPKSSTPAQGKGQGRKKRARTIAT